MSEAANNQAVTTANTFVSHASAGERMNVGSVAIEQERAIAEAQGQLILAKRFPRDMTKVFAEMMEACSSKSFAEAAFYTRPQGGKEISGPSIRFAEEAARAYGNFKYFHREYSRSDDRSEVEVGAWDMEKNNWSIRQITVLHVIDTKNGPRKLRDQAEIDNRIANVASKQMRGRILALISKPLIDDAMEKCRQTLAGHGGESIAPRVLKMVSSFAKFSVTLEMIEKYLGCPIADTTIDKLISLVGVHNAIRDGARTEDYFPSSGGPTNPVKAGKALAEAAKAQAIPAAPAQQPVAEKDPLPEKQSRPEAVRQEAAAPAIEDKQKDLAETPPVPPNESFDDDGFDLPGIEAL